MSNQWFRLYSEVLNDPKVQRLSGDLFKTWINILCVACNNNGTLPDLEDVSFALRMPLHETKTAFQELEKYALLVTDGETFQIYNWEKRQYKSDSSTERVKRHRKQKRNVTVTPPEQIQNRTDTDKKNIKKKSGKISLSEWEKQNGKMIPELLEPYREKHSIPVPRLNAMIEQFRSKCEASDYRYVNFIRAFESWSWDSEIKTPQAAVSKTYANVRAL